MRTLISLAFRKYTKNYALHSAKLSIKCSWLSLHSITLKAAGLQYGNLDLESLLYEPL